MSNAISSFFGHIFTRPNGAAYLPDVFPMELAQSVFVENDIETVYSKILTDVADRTEGLSDEQKSALCDSCLQTEAPHGLITLIAKAMVAKSDLFLVYKDGVLRKATTQEQSAIRQAINDKKPPSGTLISFKEYKRTDMVRLYSTIEYGVIASLYKGSNLAKAIQYKISDLRKSVSLADQNEAKEQASAVAKALSCGKDVMLDAKDEIASHKPDLDATKQSIEFLDSKRCFYLGLPRSYVNGESPGGLGDSGIGEAKAIERGLKNYFVSIMRPVLNAIFGVNVTFQSSDLAQVDTALEALKTFELVGDAYLSVDAKKAMIDRLLAIASTDK